jgi:hypothetical protein
VQESTAYSRQEEKSLREAVKEAGAIELKQRKTVIAIKQRRLMKKGDPEARTTTY